MEGIASAMLMIVVVIFVLKAAPLTPNSASATHMHIEKELETRGQDLLTILDYTPSDSEPTKLKKAIISWTGEEFDGQAAVSPLNTNITAEIIRKILGDIGIAYNVEVYYNTPSEAKSRAMLWNGKPSDNAVIVSRKIVLHDEEMSANPALSAIIPDMDSTSTRFYNIVLVRMTLWRM
jgi:hypothetical protein